MSRTSAPPSPARDLRLYAVLALVALGIIGGDALLLRRATAQTAAASSSVVSPDGSTGGPITSSAPAIEADSASTAETDAAIASAAASTTCAFAPGAPVANWRTLVDAADPAFGNPAAAVTVIEFFEPNCPHCAHLFPAMAEAERLTAREARFVYKPVMFWAQTSALQTQALYAAAAEAPAKFHRSMQLQLERQKSGGLTEQDVRQIATESGMNADAMMTRINAGNYRQQMMANRAAFQQTGQTGVPLVLINGKVLGEDRTPACIARLVRQEAARS